MRSLVRLPLPLVTLILSSALVTFGQLPQDPAPDRAQQQDAPDLIGQLRLAPDQLQRIRLIQREAKDERAAIGQQLLESNRALEEALDAEAVDEALIEQRIQAVNAARNAQLKVRVQTELRIRRVLTAEQLAMLKDIRLRAGDIIRGQPDRRALRPGAEGLGPAQRNRIAPMRRNLPLRNPRP